MCLLIYKPKDHEVPEAHLEWAYDNNNDSLWFAYVQNWKVITEKFLDYPTFKENLYKIKWKQAIIHFRFATSWFVDEVNCHPFIVGEKDECVKKTVGDKAIAHNWVLAKYTKPWKYSDTFHFVKHFAKLDWKVDKEKIEEMIGAWNKLVTLDKNWVYSIYNEDQWKWLNWIWYSNNSYIAYRTNYGYANYYDNYSYGAKWYLSYSEKQEESVYEEEWVVVVTRNLTMFDENWKTVYLKKWEYFIQDFYDDDDLDDWLWEILYWGWK